MDYIEFRSDACTHPTIEMREAMINSMVGDDVYEDDPTTIELEKLAAEVTGKEVEIYLLILYIKYMYIYIKNRQLYFSLQGVWPINVPL